MGFVGDSHFQHFNIWIFGAFDIFPHKVVANENDNF